MKLPIPKSFPFDWGQDHVHWCAPCRHWFRRGWLCIRCGLWRRFDFDGQIATSLPRDFGELRTWGQDWLEY